MGFNTIDIILERKSAREYNETSPGHLIVEQNKELIFRHPFH